MEQESPNCKTTPLSDYIPFTVKEHFHAAKLIFTSDSIVHNHLKEIFKPYEVSDDIINNILSALKTLNKQWGFYFAIQKVNQALFVAVLSWKTDEIRQEIVPQLSILRFSETNYIRKDIACSFDVYKLGTMTERSPFMWYDHKTLLIQTEWRNSIYYCFKIITIDPTTLAATIKNIPFDWSNKGFMQRILPLPSSIPKLLIMAHRGKSFTLRHTPNMNTRKLLRNYIFDLNSSTLQRIYLGKDFYQQKETYNREYWRSWNDDRPNILDRTYSVTIDKTSRLQLEVHYNIRHQYGGEEVVDEHITTYKNYYFEIPKMLKSIRKLKQYKHDKQWGLIKYPVMYNSIPNNT